MITNLKNKVAIVTGGAGALGGTMASGLAKQGVKVVILGRTEKTVQAKVEGIKNEGGDALGLIADVLDRKQLETARDQVLEEWNKIDVLVNAAGGNMRGATIMPEDNFFDMNMADFDAVTKLNLKGTVLPTIIFGEQMAKQGEGNVINISSMAAQQALTRVVGYSTSKASIDIFTKWLAVEMAQKHSEKIRVNAIAPGFFIGEQNRRLLLNEDGSLTARGKTIVSNTPMKRFGEAKELLSTLYWLCNDDSSFITGVVVPVDGGFSAFSGV